MLFEGVRRDFPEISFHSFEMLRGDQPDKNIQPITTERYRELLPKLEEYWNSYRNYDGFLKFVKIYSRRMELAVLEQETQVRPCHAGRVSGVLDARGEVRMCELREPVGNVRDANYDWNQLWFSPAADEQRRSIRAKECHCTHSCFMSLVAGLRLAHVGRVHGLDGRELPRLPRRVKTRHHRPGLSLSRRHRVLHDAPRRGARRAT